MESFLPNKKFDIIDWKRFPKPLDKLIDDLGFSQGYSKNKSSIFRKSTMAFIYKHKLDEELIMVFYNNERYVDFIKNDKLILREGSIGALYNNVQKIIRELNLNRLMEK